MRFLASSRFFLACCVSKLTTELNVELLVVFLGAFLKLEAGGNTITFMVIHLTIGNGVGFGGRIIVMLIDYASLHTDIALILGIVH